MNGWMCSPKWWTKEKRKEKRAKQSTSHTHTNSLIESVKNESKSYCTTPSPSSSCLIILRCKYGSNVYDQCRCPKQCLKRCMTLNTWRARETLNRCHFSDIFYFLHFGRIFIYDYDDVTHATIYSMVIYGNDIICILVCTNRILVIIKLYRIVASYTWHLINRR